MDFQFSVTRMDRNNNPDAGGQFVNAPNFNWNDGKVKFNTDNLDNANVNYGSTSGFLPKSLLNNKRRPVTDAFCIIIQI